MTNPSAQVPSGMGSVGGLQPVHNPATMPLHAVGRRVPRVINSGSVAQLVEKAGMSRHFVSAVAGSNPARATLNNSESSRSGFARIVCRVIPRDSAKTWPVKTVRAVNPVSLIINCLESGGIGRRMNRINAVKSEESSVESGMLNGFKACRVQIPASLTLNPFFPKPRRQPQLYTWRRGI